MDKMFGDGIKKFILMGIGAAAMTVEKSQQMVDELVKKGELTVEQGKELNKDLQRSFKESMNERGVDIDELSQKISKMSTDELTKIKEQIAAAQEMISERLKKVEDDVVDAADVAEEAAEDAAEAAEEKVEEAKEAAAEVAEEACDKAEEKIEEVKEAVKEAAEE